LVLLSDQDTCRFCLRYFELVFFLVLLAVLWDHVSYDCKSDGIWLASTWSTQSRRFYIHFPGFVVLLTLSCSNVLLYPNSQVISFQVIQNFYSLFSVICSPRHILIQ
jgi:hypothetical protein